MAVRPLLTNDVGRDPGDSDDDPGMDEMMEEFEGERQGGQGEDSRHRDPGEGPPGPQVTERSVAAGNSAKLRRAKEKRRGLLERTRLALQ